MTIYTQDHLRHLAELYVNNPDYDFEQIKNMDITDEFMAQYKLYFKHETLFVGNFNGNTTDGKSTAAAKLVMIGNNHLNREMSHTFILGNQQEYAYWVQDNPKVSNIVLQIDEWSEMATGGANATAEQKFFEELSNIHAQTWVHRIYCSPKSIPDPNTLIHFEVASKDIKHEITVCYVYYNLTRGGITTPQIIGHIVLDVSDVIHSKWYTKYRENKYRKINLVRVEKNMRERDLYYAKPILKTLKRLIPIAMTGRKISYDSVLSTADTICSRDGIRQTMLGIGYAIVTPVKCILDKYYDMAKFDDELVKIKKQKTKVNNSEQMEMLENKRVVLKRAQEYTQSDINYLLGHYKHMIELFEEYKKIR